MYRATRISGSATVKTCRSYGVPVPCTIEEVRGVNAGGDQDEVEQHLEQPAAVEDDASAACSHPRGVVLGGRRRARGRRGSRRTGRAART